MIAILHKSHISVWTEVMFHFYFFTIFLWFLFIFFVMFLYTYIHTYIHTFTYIYVYIYTYIPMSVKSRNITEILWMSFGLIFMWDILKKAFYIFVDKNHNYTRAGYLKTIKINKLCKVPWNQKGNESITTRIKTYIQCLDRNKLWFQQQI